MTKSLKDSWSGSKIINAKLKIRRAVMRIKEFIVYGL